MIEVTSEQIDRVNLLLGGIKNAPRNVLGNVINRALATIRSQSGKEIRQTYKIKQADITSNQNIGMKRASGSEVIEGSISYAGTLIPLIKFNATPTQPRKQPVSVSVLQHAGRKRLLHAYVANLGRYGVGVFERETNKRESSVQLMGPSTAHMAENENVLSKVEAAAMETIDKRIEQEISRYV